MKNKEQRSMAKAVLCLLLAFCIFAGELLAAAPVEAKSLTNSQKYNTVQATVQSKTSIKLSWKKKLNGKLDIYRCEVRNGKKGTYRKIASVSGSKKFYVDKKVKYKKTYFYKIVYYSLTNQSKKKEGTFYASQYTGVERIDWADDNPAYDFAKGPKFIELQIQGELDDNDKVLGLRPTGYEIYRKTGDEDYKKIAAVKSKQSYIKYKDKEVKAGKAYYYKVRSFCKLNGKTLYSDYTEELLLTATNKSGKYTIKDVSMTDRQSEFVVALTSDAGNADTVIYGAGSGLKIKGDHVSVDLTAYSTDNATWVTFDEKQPLTIEGGQTYYLKFKSRDGKAVADVTLKENTAFLEIVYVKYDGISYFIDMDLKDNTVKLWLNDND